MHHTTHIPSFLPMKAILLVFHVFGYESYRGVEVQVS
jgi:hypothetical protein